MFNVNGKLLFCVAVAIGACLSWLKRFPPNDSASAAGWAQAIGTLAAIGVAVYVPYRQRREDMRLRELRYWSERADIERRILNVAIAVYEFVLARIAEAEALAGTNAPVLYPGALHEILCDRINALETRDIGDSGHDDIATLRSALARLKDSYPVGTVMTLGVDSPFGLLIKNGPIYLGASNCVTKARWRLTAARANVSRLSVDTPESQEF